MTRRPRRSVPATLTGLVLLAACALVATDSIQILARSRPLISYARLASDLHRLHWNGLTPAIAAGVLALLGLILLLAALVPGRPVVIALLPVAPGTGTAETGTAETGTAETGTAETGTAETGAPETGAPETDGPMAGPLPDSGVSRRGLRNLLSMAAGSVDGVTSIRLALRRKTIAATVRTLGSTEAVASDVRAVLEQRLDQVSPASRPVLRVKATTRSAS